MKFLAFAVLFMVALVASQPIEKSVQTEKPTQEPIEKSVQTEKSTQEPVQQSVQTEQSTQEPVQQSVQTEQSTQEQVHQQPIQQSSLQTEKPTQEQVQQSSLQTEKPTQQFKCGTCYTEDTCSNATIKLCDNAENCYKVYRDEKAIFMACNENPSITFFGAQNGTCTKLGNDDIVCVCSTDLCNMDEFEIKHLRSWFQKVVGWFSE